jgi:hypothetical protein
MTAPFLVPCLVQLRDQFNHEFPDRAKGADGWIGDNAHATENPSSDHNPNIKGQVRAIDITTDLKRPGISLWDVCEMLRGSPRLEYIIHMRKIASRSHGWTWRTYTGTADPHTNHAHFSARADGTGYNDKSPWGLEELMTKDELRAAVQAELAEFFAVGKQDDGSQTSLIGRHALSQGIPPNGISGEPRQPAYKVIGDTHRLAVETAAKVDALITK